MMCLGFAQGTEKQLLSGLSIRSADQKFPNQVQRSKAVGKSAGMGKRSEVKNHCPTQEKLSRHLNPPFSQVRKAPTRSETHTTAQMWYQSL